MKYFGMVLGIVFLTSATVSADQKRLISIIESRYVHKSSLALSKSEYINVKKAIDLIGQIDGTRSDVFRDLRVLYNGGQIRFIKNEDYPDGLVTKPNFLTSRLGAKPHIYLASSEVDFQFRTESRTGQKLNERLLKITSKTYDLQLLRLAIGLVEGHAILAGKSTDREVLRILAKLKAQRSSKFKMNPEDRKFVLNSIEGFETDFKGFDFEKSMKSSH